MSSAKTSAVSGCIVWVLSVGVIVSCTLPIFIVIGSITSFTQVALDATGNFTYPDGTTTEHGLG